jgi:hypothetical protein
MTVDFVPPSDTKIWAWLHWTDSLADMDLHVKPAPAKPNADIYWERSKIEGIPGRMLLWRTYSGQPEVFVVDNERSGNSLTYSFSAKPDRKSTLRRRNSGEKIEPAKLLFVLWTSQNPELYKTESQVMEFDTLTQSHAPEIQFKNTASLSAQEEPMGTAQPP